MRHPYDHEAAIPFLLIHDRYKSPIVPKCSAGYYDKLRKLLVLPEV